MKAVILAAGFTNEFSNLMEKRDDSNLVLSYQCKDEETIKYGILEVDEHLQVRCMREKPHASETNSRRACPCFYLLSKKSILLLDTFLDEKKTAPIEEKDAPGNFLSWLISSLAMREPNCMALLGSIAEGPRPRARAASLSRSFSPRPRGRE
ncbi:hypothetical protein JZ751_029498, partial [Albula glossodonta]